MIHPVQTLGSMGTASRLVRDTLDLNVYVLVELLPDSGVARFTSIRDGRYLLYGTDRSAIRMYADEFLGRTRYGQRHMFCCFDARSDTEQLIPGIMDLAPLCKRKLFMFVEQDGVITAQDVRAQSVEHIREYVRDLQAKLVKEG